MTHRETEVFKIYVDSQHLLIGKERVTENLNQAICENPWIGDGRLLGSFSLSCPPSPPSPTPISPARLWKRKGSEDTKPGPLQGSLRNWGGSHPRVGTLRDLTINTRDSRKYFATFFWEHNLFIQLPILEVSGHRCQGPTSPPLSADSPKSRERLESTSLSATSLWQT